MRKILSWYAAFLFCCALLGLLAGVVSATTGLDFLVGHSYASRVPLLGTALPTSNTFLMTVAAALMASLAFLRGMSPFQRI